MYSRFVGCRSYKFRLYPTKSQEIRLVAWLGICCELYNACLQERRDAWAREGRSVTRYGQQGDLPTIKAALPDVADVGAAVLQNVCTRVDLAFKAFFRRSSAGQRPGYPRFKSVRRYRSFTHPQAAHAGLTERRIRIPSFGWVRWKPWKDPGSIGVAKTLTVKREADGWYAILACEVSPAEPLPVARRTTGIDVGLKNLVTTSDGDVLGDLAPLKAAEKKLRKSQREISRKVRGSSRWRKATTIFARRHQDLARARKAQLDTISKRLVANNDVICVEELSPGLRNAGPKTAQGRGLRRNWRHAATEMLVHMLTYKAESAGRRVVLVDPRGTTRDCSSCGASVPKTLGDREHRCICGCVLDRDHNAAINIKIGGLRLLRGNGSNSAGSSDPAVAVFDRKVEEARRRVQL